MTAAEKPTPSEVRKAKKAELVAWCESLDLSTEGTADELRRRLLTHLETAEEKPAKEAPAKEEAEKPAEEEVVIEEKKEGYAAKAKPKLDAATRNLLELRRLANRRRPRFLRQEWFRYARLGETWRHPRGSQGKRRRHYGYRPDVPSIGWRGPAAVRGLHPSGFREVLIHRVEDLERIDPKHEAARVAAGVGMRRRLEIEKAAEEKGVRVLNRSRSA